MCKVVEIYEPDKELVECPECKDDGLFWSGCCYAPIIYHDICSECKDHCEAEQLFCDRCKNEGVIYI